MQPSTRRVNKQSLLTLLFHPCRALITLSVTTKGQGNGSEVKVINLRLITRSAEHNSSAYIVFNFYI
jgi:hypothetical protein